MTQAIEQAPPPRLALPLTSDGELNRISMNIDGDRVILSGVLNLKGLRMLEKKIATLKTLLEVDEEDGDDDHSDIA